jgi:hypothetical protein
MAKKLRCYLGMHRWVRKVQADQPYYECKDCGKDRDPYDPSGISGLGI